MDTKYDVIVIGGGVIGICCAYYLNKAGYRVIVLEKSEVCSGASYGNAGLLTPSHAVPLPNPDAFKNGLKWLFDSTSPLYIKPRLNLELARWLVRFMASSTEETVKRAIPAMFTLGDYSIDLFEETVRDENLDCNFHHNGWTLVFNTQKGFDECAHEAETLRPYGVVSEVWSGEETRSKEPALTENVLGAVHHPNDAHLCPGDYVTQLAARFESNGGKITSGEEVRSIEQNDSSTIAISTASNTFHARHAVLANGYEADRFSGRLGVRIPIQPAKGYAIIIDRPDHGPNIPMLLGDAYIGVNPMGDQLRFAGTLELAGDNLSISQHRIDTMIRKVPGYLRDIDLSDPVEIWRGMRPCTPDGLPMIGPSPRFPNIYLAIGHGMLGVTQGPGTGKTIADLIAGDSPPIDITRFDTDRF